MGALVKCTLRKNMFITTWIAWMDLKVTCVIFQYAGGIRICISVRSSGLNSSHSFGGESGQSGAGNFHQHRSVVSLLLVTWEQPIGGPQLQQRLGANTSIWRRLHELVVCGKYRICRTITWKYCGKSLTDGKRKFKSEEKIFYFAENKYIINKTNTK